jgi:hypothetical protein
MAKENKKKADEAREAELQDAAGIVKDMNVMAKPPSFGSKKKKKGNRS